MIEERVDDKPFLGLIDTWLKAGILECDGMVTHPHTGTPQGGVISPLLANIYLHYVVDLWFERVVKPSCKGQAYLVRYADDFVCAFQYEHDAKRFFAMLPQRLEKFSLSVAPEKTCIHRFCRFKPTRRRRFTFLGFEFYWEADTKGVPRVWRRTSKPKLWASLRACKDWLKANRTLPLSLLLDRMKRKVRGHYNYFRVVGNSRALRVFHTGAVKLLHKWLNRRSQRRSLTWGQLTVLLGRVSFPCPI